MADVPQVTIANGVPTAGSGTVQTLSTVTDILGATTGAAVITDANGTVQQYLRGIVSRWAAALGAGTAAAALRVTLASDGPGVAVLGATTGAKVITDADGSIQQYLRGLISQWIAGTLVLGAGENFLGIVGGKAVAVGATMTRTADSNSYAVGDIVAQSVTAGSCSGTAVAVSRANDKSGMLRRVRVKVNDITPWTNAILKVHCFKDTPTFTNADNAAFSGGLSESNYLGAFDCTLDRVFSDFVKGTGSPSAGSEINFEPSSGTQNIFYVIETRSAITTPGSAKVFTVVFEVLQN